jgi:short subunit dehydrogenase
VIRVLGEVHAILRGSVTNLHVINPVPNTRSIDYLAVKAARLPYNQHQQHNPGVTDMVEMPGQPRQDRQARDAGLTQGATMDLNLAGKVAVVTGAGKGIGMATTLALADEGARVVAGSRTTGTLDGLKGVTPVAVDLTATDGPAQLIRHATEEHGRIDVLVNNVGAVRMRTDGFFGTSDEDFAWAMQMNFFIALRASRAALTEMIKNGSGAIVNVASVNAFFQPDAATIDLRSELAHA